MVHPEIARGMNELRQARAQSSGLLWAVAIFSAFVNLLMLTGPLFMMQVYDRVLGSRSEATLAALFGLVIFLFLVMGVLDFVRVRVMSRVSARFQSALEARVFAAALKRSAQVPDDPAAAAGLRDLEAVQRLLASPVLMAIFDVPWAPFFLLAVFVFHPMLGALALCGGILLLVVTILNQRSTASPSRMATGATLLAERMADQLRSESEMVQALGMQATAFRRWRAARVRAMGTMMTATDAGAVFTVFTKTFRMFLQSAMLALGAWLVLRGEMSAGAMIASSILMGRALAPVEQAIGGWATLIRAQEGWHRMALLLGAVPQDVARTPLPRPTARVEVSQLSVVPPGQNIPSLRGVSFKIAPGQAIGVIGPSGAGKSSLARAVTGVWRIAQGHVRLDGATLEQYEPDILGGLIGYLPQRVTLFDGTIAENIARLSDAGDPQGIVEAAQKAAAHQMILDLPEGYDTRVSQAGGQLSGGQIQRIGLARALYGDPVLLVLDEPNSNLDNDGSIALNAAIKSVKASGGAVMIMAHRPAAIAECQMLLVLEGGMLRAFGPRDEVLKAMVKNASEISGKSGPGGVV
jgi:ATP-binding cassette subfamily C protein